MSRRVFPTTDNSIRVGIYGYMLLEVTVVTIVLCVLHTVRLLYCRYK